MSAGCERRARLLLKARPTPEQLADRMSEPIPEGLELYLDRADLAEEGWREATASRVAAMGAPADFQYVVEGPLRSLDGAFFDIGRDSEANRETLRRVVSLGQTIGARLAVIHCIAPVEVAGVEDGRANGALEAALPLARFYAHLCQDGGLVPTVENIPPVARMREDRLMGSHIGVRPGDLRWVVEHVPGLHITLDTSHAQLYVNAARGFCPEDAPDLRPLVQSLAADAEVDSLDDFIRTLEEWTANVHVSNAGGLLDEGLPYGQGDADLDGAVRRLAPVARYLVTETLEPDSGRAVLMREAMLRMRQALGCP